MDPVPTIRQISNASLWEFTKHISKVIWVLTALLETLLDWEAKLFLAQAGKAALGMFCIFIFNWVTIIMIVKFICGFAL